jgi:hypothetical protein
MLDLATVSRVPAEFTGQARVFRDQVRAVDLAMDAALAMITEPLRARLGRHPKLRNEMVAGTARLYSMVVPPQFRLGAVEVTRHRNEFAIVERRIAVSWLRHDEWTDPEHREPGVSVCRFILAMTDGKLLWRLHPQANVSLHALARRIERGHERDHAALLRDLAVLANAGEEGERVATGEGSWFGPVIDADDQGHRIRMRNVRTWLPTDCGQADRQERRPAQSVQQRVG